ncbi:MAG: hypothetical protein AB1420_16705 [Bacillota bacterium]
MSAIKKKQYSSVSFIGMAKNVGKTTAFNYLLKQCFVHNYPIGIASLGRDGEKIDAITGTEKPQILAAKDTLIASAKHSILKSSASLEILEDTGYVSSLGPIYVARVRRPGFIELATTPSAKKMKDIIQIMKGLGAKLVIVDGALDRTSSAAPETTDSTILSTGASLNSQMDVVVKKTAARVQQLTLPSINTSSLHVSSSTLQQLHNAESSLVIGEDDHIILAMDKKSLGYEKHLLGFLKNQKIKYVYINGAVVGSLLNIFVANRKTLQNTTLVVKNGANILVDYQEWDRYLKAHGNIKALKPINLIAVTCNPTSYRGDSFPPEKFVDALAANLPGFTVVDLILGIKRRNPLENHYYDLLTSNL